MDYEWWIREADQIPFEGWDFGVFRGRFAEAEPPWEFSKLLRTHMRRSSSMLDLGTGGGEFLSSLAPLPPETVATEAYEPNVPIARRRSGSRSSTPRIAATSPSLSRYDDALRALHAVMESGTPLKVNSHRFLIIARSR